MEAIEQLIANIRKSGQLEPVKIWFTGESFRITDGEKCCPACKKVGASRNEAVGLEDKT